ncbi:hypothetical protein QJS04_geneDACA015890 [Acorus gramineus]|uniref:CCHC-type domain-containing protein n=1 Tax=Acorus gramineus TaxID=55184 RepID=A0AAV9BLZ3_ACOGR|nr:hypothetical protein QJS04_geneDACA015890 [Acorus gramineus]
MDRQPSPEIDDELFDSIYGKEYTGPPGMTVNRAPENPKASKRPRASTESDDEDESFRDPNAVPTDFTSREAKVWEAKAKATERNWKKRKEEEMICKICGVSGHFTQGCPSTLGANRKSADFFERVAARDKHIRAHFTEKVIHRIEKDVGCKIKMDEKFIIVSGKDRLILAKGVDAVHKVIHEEDRDRQRCSSSSRRTRSRSPAEAPVGSQFRRSESQRSRDSRPSPRDSQRFQSKNFNQEKVVEGHLREDLQHMSRGHPQAFGNDGARGRSSYSKSPSNSGFTGDALGSYDGHARNVGVNKNVDWDAERRGADTQPSGKPQFPAYPQTLEELETEFKREAMEIGRIRDEEEDEENYKHRERVRELRENYMKKLAIMRGMQSKKWKEFFQSNNQQLQHARQNMSASGYNAHNHTGYSDYDGASGNPRYAGNNFPADSRARYPFPPENYSSSRPNDSYGDFQRQRNDGFGKAYGRY